MRTQFDREILINDLRLHTCKIHFTKVNGQKRIMICTLLPEHLPANTNRDALNEAHQKPENKDSIAVWDLENGGWRSFRVDTVEYAEIIDGY